MAEALTDRVWTGRALYVVLALGIIFIALLPLNTMPHNWFTPALITPDSAVRHGVGPDILLLVTLIWAIRRPDHVPVLLVGAVFLLTDFRFDRAPGLWTACVVILTEALRARAPGLRTQPFLFEWMTVAFGIVAIAIAARTVLSVALVPQAPVMLTLIQVAMTALVYPVVAGAAWLAFGIGRPAPGEVDATGRPL